MPEVLINMALALAVGLIVGIERGWQEREATEGSRVAGLRTFVLVSLMGGLCELLSADQSRVLFGLAYLSLALVLILAHFAESRVSGDFGITTVIAALVTFLLGALAVHGERVIAASGAVVVALLLNLKPVLHDWLQRIEMQELRAALKLLLLSVVVLPFLPNQGYGPWNALNPYRIWWFVVIVAAISFAAYIAVKATGPRRGIALTGLLGGLVSSTGVTLQLARLAKSFPRADLLSAGILVASAVMFVRVLLVLSIVNRDLAMSLAAPLLAMAFPLALGAVVFGRDGEAASAGELKLSNPLEILEALKFGALLTTILIVSKGMQAGLGHAGLYIVALVAGLADVDAITLSLAQMPKADFPVALAAKAVIVATMVNTLTKGILALSVGGGAIGRRVLPPAVAAAVLGGIALWRL